MECDPVAANAVNTIPRARAELKFHSLPRPPQARAAPFKWLYRKRPGPEIPALPASLSTGSLPIQR